MTEKEREAMRTREAIRLLEEDVIQMERWADESLSGGWSTHQVRPMRERAKRLREQIGFLKEKPFRL